MSCDCNEWKENVSKVNAGFEIMAVHGMGGYSGKIFKYCPWCAKELQESND